MYGTLKRGHYNDYLLEDSKLIGTGVTEPLYTMYSMGGFPVVTKGGNTAIHVEVYDVQNERVLNNLHQLENFSGKKDDPSNWYDMTTVNVEGIGEAELYYQKEMNYNRPVVETGNW